MAIAKITGQGLTSIAILVALLWACVIGEKVLRRGAVQDTAEVLQAMRMMKAKDRHEPASAPAHTPLRHPRADLG